MALFVALDSGGTKTLCLVVDGEGRLVGSGSGGGANPNLVGEVTARESVRRAVEQLGYVPNPAARSLVTRQTDTLAVVVPEDDARVFSDPFIAQAIGGVAEALAHTPKQRWLRSSRAIGTQLAVMWCR